MLLVLMMVLFLGGLAFFFYSQRAAAERAMEAQAARVKSAEIIMHQDIQTLLLDAQQCLDHADEKGLKAAIRKISILDIKGDFATELAELKSQFFKLRSDKDEVQKQLKQHLEAEELDAVELAIAQLELLGVDVAIHQHELAVVRQSLRVREAAFSQLEEALGAWRLEQARTIAGELQEMQLNDLSEQRLAAMQSQLAVLSAQEKLALQRAEELSKLDSGEYSAELIERVADSLDELSSHPSLLKLQEKISAYPQTVRVPGDVASLEDALEILRAGDILQLGEGVFYAEVTITQPITIRGAGIGKTIIESGVHSGPAFFFQHAEGQSTLTGVELKGDRSGRATHSLIVVKDANLQLSNCRISRSPAHGVAVLAGKVVIKDCSISDNRWDGITAHGADSLVTITTSQVLFNGEHGVDFWGGSRGVVFKCELSENSKSGLVIMGTGTAVRAALTQSFSNRGAGFYVADQARAICESVEAKGNTCSGFVLKGAQSSLELTSSVSKENLEFGYLIDPQSTFTHSSPLAGEKNLLGPMRQKVGK